MFRRMLRDSCGRDDGVARDDLALGGDENDVVEGEAFFELTRVHAHLRWGRSGGSRNTKAPARAAAFGARDRLVDGGVNFHVPSATEVSRTDKARGARGTPCDVIAGFRGIDPTIDPTVFVAASAVVVGDVVIGAEASLWFHTVVRGDVRPIRIGARTNLQDHVTVHVVGGRLGTTIGDDVDDRPPRDRPRLRARQSAC